MMHGFRRHAFRLVLAAALVAFAAPGPHAVAAGTRPAAGHVAPGRPADGRDLPDPLEARRGLHRAYAFLSAQPTLRLDVVWMLRTYILPAFPDELLHAKVEAEVPRLARKPGFGLLLDPDQPRPKLVPEPPAGEAPGALRFLGSLEAAFAVPEAQALERLRRFAEQKDTSGYVLTHQLLALKWWQSAGRVLPPDLEKRYGELLAAIAREQSGDGKFSDLYAERATLLVFLGSDRCPETLPGWVRVTLAAQERDGSWGDPHWVFEYDGTQTRAQSRSHTAALGSGIYAAYLRCAGQAGVAVH